MNRWFRPDWAVARPGHQPQPSYDIFQLALLIYAMIAGPGKHPPASQLDDPEFDLHSLLQGNQNAEAVQRFVKDHVVTAERDVKSRDIKEFIARLDELLARFDWRPSEHQVFSFLSAHSTTHVNENDLSALQLIAMRLPEGARRLQCAIRLLRGAKTHFSDEVAVVVRQLGKPEAIASYDGGTIVHPSGPKLGNWFFLPQIRLPESLNPGWYTLSIEKVTGGVLVTGLLVYVESLS